MKSTHNKIGRQNTVRPWVHCLAAGMVFVLAAGADADAAERTLNLDQRMQFTIASQPLAAALLQFSSQAKVQIVTAGNEISSINTRGVKGQHSIGAGLKSILSGTGFTYRISGDNTISIVREEPASNVRASSSQISMAIVAEAGATDERRAAASSSSVSATAAASTEDAAGDTTEKEIVVTGSHISGQTAANAAQPVFTLTRQDIERTGALSLGDLFRYIPQISQVETGEETASAEGGLYLPGGVVVTGMPSLNQNSNRVSAGLRGAPAGGTLILVNGRRAPRNGQMDGNDAYDVAGVPVGAIERIDVLPAGASAIYGADALGGVMNIILRKDHSGTEVRLGHENTFDKDAGVVMGEISHHFSSDRWSGRVSGTFQESNTMALKDRDFTASLDRRPYGGADFRGNPAVPGTPVGGSGKLFLFGGTLPGSSLGYAPIPTGSAGQSTQAQYLAAGSALQPYDQSQYMSYNTPYERRSADGSVQYEFSRYLTVALEGRWSDSEMTMTMAPVTGNAGLPAGAAGNPFNVPVRLSKIFFDLPRGQTVAESTNQSGLLALSGDLAGQWNYRAGASVSRAETGSRTTGGAGFDFFRLLTALNGPNPPILAYDSVNGQNPNAPGVLEGFINVVAPNEEHVREWVYDATVSGPVLTLPSGKVHVAVGAEYRDSDVDFPLMDLNDPNNRWYARARDTNSSAFFAEAQIPVIGERWSRPGARELSFNIAARHDEYTAYSGKTVMSYGMFFRPLERLALRSTWSEGFKVPTLLQRYEPLRVGIDYYDPVYYAVPDPLRGNTPLIGEMPTTRGGNPDLRPERSENLSAGLELEMPGIDGLRLTLDYFRSEYLDRISGVDPITQLLSFPETITRGDRLPNDPAGWAGPVIGIDARNINTAFTLVDGWDLGVNYAQQMHGGVLTTRAAMTKTKTNEFRAQAGDPLDPNTSTDQLPMQFSGSVFFERGAWDMGVLCVHQGRKRSLPNQAFTDSATRWDLQASYDVAADGNTAPWWLRDTRLSLTIFNALNTRPPFNYQYLPDNGVLDSRMRRYSLSLVRDF